MSNIEGKAVRMVALTAMMAAIGAINAIAAPPIRSVVPVSTAAAPNSVLTQDRVAKGDEQIPPASLPGQAFEIVVKFKDDAKVKDIVETFWKDAPAAKAKFETFKRGRPEMVDTVLDRVTYSGELVLVRLCKDGPLDGPTAMRAIAARLAAAPDIAYAEVNAIARIEGQ